MKEFENDAKKIYSCDACQAAVPGSTTRGATQHCPNCHSELHHLTTDVRPVFARERCILEFYGHESLSSAVVWRGSHNQYYYINGQSVEAPSISQMQDDLPALRAYLNATEHCDTLDKQLIVEYRHLLATDANLDYLKTRTNEAMSFVGRVRGKFPHHLCIVSFSGGKDSTVVSHLVRWALHPARVIHVFGDTTLEDPNTHRYMQRFRQQTPNIEFWRTSSDRNFFDLVDEIGPPSRVMRWCCTIFKTGPINRLLQSFEERGVLTFYGIRKRESQARSTYDRVGAKEQSLGQVLSVDPDNGHGVTLGAKIGQQITASPILDWSEFDVWLYILLNGLDFNDAYRWGFSRVGCWLCPMNSRWSEVLTQLYFPKMASRWRDQLVRFAASIGKPDPGEYVDDRAWVRRFGGAGMDNRFRGIDTSACGEKGDTIQINLSRPVMLERFLEFLKPLGRIDISRSRVALGEVVLVARRGINWSELSIQAVEGHNTMRATVLGAKDPDRVLSFVRFQAIKYQTCIRCGACAAVCPQGAIVVSADPDLYEVNESCCTGCLECVTHYGSTGCLVAKSLSVYGEAAQ